MSTFRKIAYAIRHAPIVNRIDWLWDLLRRPYHWLLNFGGNGVQVSIGDEIIIRIPAEFTGSAEWATYEPETVTAMVNWLRANTEATLLDVGSSIGVFSAAALFASDEVEVFAFDSDLASLKALGRFCQYAAGTRVHPVFGFVSESHPSNIDLRTASDSTTAQLRTVAVSGDPGTTSYTLIHDNQDETIPRYSIDGLLFGNSPPAKPLLLKCDVEGAELLVLRGSQRMLDELAPPIILSVHSKSLPDYGHSVDEIRDFLIKKGYTIRLLAIDHEEHWWCEKADRD